MIRSAGLEDVMYFNSGGLTVYFDSATWNPVVDGCVELRLRGISVCSIYIFNKGAKSRIAELRKAGFLESESEVKS